MSSLSMLTLFEDNFREKWSYESVRSELKTLAIGLGMNFEELILWAATGKKPEILMDPDCFTLDAYEAEWPVLSPEKRKHIKGCKFCQKLLPECFPFLELKENHFGTFNIDQFKEETRVLLDEMGEPCKYFADSLNIEGIQFIPLPLAGREEDKSFSSAFVDPHIAECPYCQLLIQYYVFKEHSLISRTDMNHWAYYPVYAGSDTEYVLKTLIEPDNFGQTWAPIRFKINFYLDRELYKMMKDQSPFLLKLKLRLEKIRKPIGDIIGSFRYHTSPFAKRHPWSKFTKTQRMAKLLYEENLHPTEELYKKVLAGEVSLEEAVVSISKSLRKPSYVFWGQKFVLQENISEIRSFLKLAKRAKENGVSIETEIEKADERFTISMNNADRDMWHFGICHGNVLYYERNTNTELPICTLRNPNPGFRNGGVPKLFENLNDLFSGYDSPILKGHLKGSIEVDFEKIFDLKDHIWGCPECQLVLASFWQPEDSDVPEDGVRCLGYGELLNYPIINWKYRKDKPEDLENHIENCDRCTELINYFCKKIERLAPDPE